MGLFSGLFGKNENGETEKTVFQWIPLNSLHQLIQIEEKSRIKPQVIFKHSTSCGISRMVIRTFTDSFDHKPEAVDVYYLDLHAFREVSNETGYKFQVMHQSPQVIVIKNGVAIAHASHGAINDLNFHELLK